GVSTTRMSRRKLQRDRPTLSPLPPRPVPLGKWWAVLAVVMIAYLAFGAAHIAYTPVAPNTNVNYINAPDEAAHLRYVRALAEKGHVPVRDDPEYPTYEWHQPPLYYSIVALVYSAGPRAVRGATL